MTEGIPARRDLERRFRLVSTPIAIGPGAMEEAGWELKQLVVFAPLLAWLVFVVIGIP